MPLYRKKPVVVEAVQFTGTNTVEIAELLGWSYSGDGQYSDSIIIETLEGDMTANVGDWVIKGVQEEGYPCRDDIFRLTYEAVDADEEL
jgi:hypothetical protein